MNTFITTQIEMKKLRFHLPNKQGKTKCNKIHIGNNHKNCLDLKVHGINMKNVESYTYLGDIISCDGKNSENIKSRVSRGLGIVTRIMNLLEEVSFGGHIMSIGILLRDSMLINGMLTNSEVW